MAGLLITGIYILKAIQKVLHGPLGEEWQHHPLRDISVPETLAVAPLMVGMLVIGIFPAVVLNIINVGVVRLFQ
jgi:NADH-quinone oxidoreductase subunit M